MNNEYLEKVAKEIRELLESGDLQWHQLANCAGTDPDAFFPEHSESQKAPKLVCKSCPVQVDCLNYALRNNIEHGIWGGLSAWERIKIRRRNLPNRPQGRPSKENTYAEYTG